LTCIAEPSPATATHLLIAALPQWFADQRQKNVLDGHERYSLRSRNSGSLLISIKETGSLALT
jgi:hypothetical protein